MPFKHVPPQFIIQMVYSSTWWRNMFVLAGGISATQSPSEIVLNRALNYHHHCGVEMFQYVQTHEEHDNSLSPRTIGAIAMRPTGDGSYNFISVATGRVVNRRSFTPLPLPNEVIDQVHRLARRAKASRELTFTNRDNIDLDTLYADLDMDDDDLQLTDDAEAAGVVDSDSDDDDDDEDYDPNDDEDNGSDSEAEDNTEDGGSDDEDNDIEMNDDEDDNDEDIDTTDGIPGVQAEDNEEELDNTGEEMEPHGTESPGVNDNPDEDMESPGVTSNADEPQVSSNEEETNEQDEPVQTTGVRRSQRERRPNSLMPESDYVFATCGDSIDENEQMLLLTVDDDNDSGYKESMVDKDEAEWTFLTEQLGWKEGLQGDEPTIDAECEYLFTTEQMSWKKGLKVFGEKGEEAIIKEMKQVHDLQGFQPKHWYELTKEERAAALKYLMYLKEKRDGRVKGRGCADGRKQRAYISREEASSPTANLMSIVLTSLIDAFNGNDVATVDIPVAFCQAKQPEEDRDVHVVLDGRMAELLAKISPNDYQEYVHPYRGQSRIYCKLNVALYGTLKGAVLFWKRLSSYLKNQGFVINPYDWCVANKTVDGEQCTIVWHVDDLKISHKSSSVVDDVIASLKEEFGKVAELTVTRGKVHDYLGMTLDFSDPKSVAFCMEKYLGEVLADLPEDMNGTATTPAADYLFKTRDDAPKLDQERASLFHRVTAQLLFASQRARPDLRTAISFLTKRVQSPDEDDYKKLARVVKYVRRTKFLRLKIEADHLDQNHWFIDGAFAVHNDMKSHTGAYMTFGKGMVNGLSSAQKINTSSSTEAEVVAVHDNVPSILWTRYFMEAQGYPMKPSVVHQDNQSAMLLETNGIASSSKRTRHMNIRYFFVADMLERREITLEYCPTDEMIGDFFTKPLGGAKFRRFRNIIMNISHDEYGPVDVDELMEIHRAKVLKRIEMKGNANHESSDKDDTDQPEDSQECVGAKTRRSMCIAKKEAQNANEMGAKPSYAEVVAADPISHD